jgi:hypothetical protein
LSKKRFFRSGIWSVVPILLLAGCNDTGAVSYQELYDMKLQHVVTSPIPGAAPKVLPPPPGIIYTGAPVGACVTSAGYCPLAAATEPGQNCLCTAPDATYGGTTGIPPQYNKQENHW